MQILLLKNSCYYPTEHSVCSNFRDSSGNVYQETVFSCILLFNIFSLVLSPTCIQYRVMFYSLL
jgi:hypothetical protein